MNLLIFQLPAVEMRKRVLEHVHDIGCVHGVVKTAISVNTGELNGAALERALTNRLRGLLIGVALHAYGTFCARCLPESSLQLAASRRQPDDLQRCIVAESARNHARHRMHRRASGHHVYRMHLLDFPRQGEARQIKLLSLGLNNVNGMLSISCFF
jgi:hypothetical protein